MPPTFVELGYLNVVVRWGDKEHGQTSVPRDPFTSVSAGFCWPGTVVWGAN